MFFSLVHNSRIFIRNGSLLQYLRGNTSLSDVVPRIDAQSKYRGVLSFNTALKALRATLGLFILVTLVSAMLIPQVLPVTGKSVVNARLEWMRTPIMGNLSFEKLKVGDTVAQGDVLGSITNIRADDNFLNQLKSEKTRIESTLFALSKRRAQLLERESTLKQRVDDSLRSFTEKTTLEVEATEAALQLAATEVASLDSTIERYKVANREFSSTEPYAVVSRTTMDSKFAELVMQKAVLNGFENTLVLLKAELDAARAGVFKPEKTPLEQQQLRDVQLAISDIEQQRVSITMKAAQLEVDIDARQKYLRRNEYHDVIARVSGTVWDIAYADGSYVHNGDSLVAIADTTSLRVEGFFHQRYLDNISVGDYAVVDLMGSDEKLDGRVSEVRIRDQVKSADLTAFNYGSADANEFKVVVTIDADQKRIPQIGQRAKIIISQSPNSIVPRLLLFFNR